MAIEEEGEPQRDDQQAGVGDREWTDVGRDHPPQQDAFRGRLEEILRQAARAVVGEAEPGRQLVDAPAQPLRGRYQPEFDHAEEADQACRPDDQHCDKGQVGSSARWKDSPKEIKRRDQEEDAQPEDALRQRCLRLQHAAGEDKINQRDRGEGGHQAIDRPKSRAVAGLPKAPAGPQRHAQQGEQDRLLPRLQQSHQ